jgi:hypothetical protein
MDPRCGAARRALKAGHQQAHVKTHAYASYIFAIVRRPEQPAKKALVASTRVALSAAAEQPAKTTLFAGGRVALSAATFCG